MSIEIPSPAEEEDRVLSCPKCKAPMEKITFQDIHVDRCTACKGLWFDMLEREHLDELKGSESIDIGSPPAGKADAPVHINCPVCHTPMIRMVDLEHPSIHFESCTVCFGAFFDAGEFREHKEHHVLGLFQDWFRGKAGE